MLVGWEIDWGAALRMHPPPAESVAPKSVATGLLPDYVIAGGIDGHAETVDRPLFNPTRRPAPAAAIETAKPVMQKGLYTLTGTTVTGERSLAFLKETKGGKFRTVRQGETIDGMLVAEVKPDRVTLTLDGDSEELLLKVATNPKPTPQPVAPRGAGAISPGARPQLPGARPQLPGDSRRRRRRWRNAGARRARHRPPPLQRAPRPAAFRCRSPARRSPSRWLRRSPRHNLPPARGPNPAGRRSTSATSSAVCRNDGVANPMQHPHDTIPPSPAQPLRAPSRGA